MNNLEEVIWSESDEVRRREWNAMLMTLVSERGCGCS